MNRILTLLALLLTMAIAGCDSNEPTTPASLSPEERKQFQEAQQKVIELESKQKR